MQAIESINGLKIELKKTKNGVAGDTIFSAKAILYMAEELTEIKKILSVIAKKDIIVIQKKWWEFWK
mgnify:CR=1 FL=1